MTWIVLALIVLAVGAVASLLAGQRGPGGLGFGLAAAATAAVLSGVAGGAVLAGASPAEMGLDWPLPVGLARMSVDGLSAWFLVVIGTVGFGVAIYAWGYLRGGDGHGHTGVFSALLCTMIAAMILVVCAADVVLFLLGWEMMSLSAFFLVGFHGLDAEARRGAWTYLIATHLGTAFGVLPVFAALVARSGGTAMGAFAGSFSGRDATWVTVIFLLGLVGFGTKAGFVPFHVWLPAAHPVAPSPVSALMSGVVIKTGIYGLLRLLSWLPELPIGCAVCLMAVSLVTGLMGILFALGQGQIKRMLAYSSIENIGIIGLAISVAMLGRSLHQPVLTALGLGGALLHVLNHALFKGLLFLSAGAVVHDAGTGDVERLGGLARNTPVNALAFLTGSVAICALPPLNGFVSEFLIYSGILGGVSHLPGAYAALMATCAVALALIGGLALVVFAKTFSVVFLGERRDRGLAVHPTPATMNAGMMFLAVACLAAALASAALKGPLLTASAALLPVGGEEAATLAASLGLIGRLSPLFGLLVVAAGGLFLLRRRLPSGAAAGGMGGTWGCGFAAPTPAMQYTGSSFAWKVIYSFRHVIRPRRRAPVIAGPFPGQGKLATAVTDLAQVRIYEPAFKGLARAFERFWPLQHGRIQLYLVYIAATVLIVFLVESWGSVAGRDADGAAAAALDGREVEVGPAATGGGHPIP